MLEFRRVWTLIAAVGLLQVAGGILGVVTPLGLEALGVRAPVIGLIAACHAAGFMAGAASAPFALHAFGNIRVYSAAAAMTAACALAMDLYPDPVFWTVFRVVQGAAFAWMFASVESWLSVSLTPRHRGGVTGVYHVVAKAALMIGPFLAAGVSALDSRSYLWCGVFLSLSLVPICLTDRVQPGPPKAAPLPPWRLFAVAPAGVIGVFFAGMINTGTLALLPVFAQYMPSDAPLVAPTGLAALAMAAAQFGGLIGQWPIGRLSDRIDRRKIIASMAALSCGAALVLGLFFPQLPTWADLSLLTAWGLGALSVYGVSVAHAVDRSEPREIARVMSGLLFVFALGSVMGPLLSGTGMRIGFGPGGLFLVAAGLSGVLVAAMLARVRVRAAPTGSLSERWKIAQPTSVSGGAIDPRATADLDSDAAGPGDTGDSAFPEPEGTRQPPDKGHAA